LSDGLGSTANLTNGASATTATYSYGVFGAVRCESGSAAPANEWRFTGEQRDRQISRQFYYLRARYYDPAIGRFLSQDALPSGNLYAFVGNNPVNYVDRSGANPCGVAVTTTVVVSATTGAETGGATVVVTSAGAAAVSVGTVLVAVCEAEHGGCISSALDAAGSIGGTLVEGVSDLAGKVGGLFKSESRGEKIEKWYAKVKAAAGIAARIGENAIS
jgi:RHS repeat-associated protein